MSYPQYGVEGCGCVNCGGPQQGMPEKGMPEKGMPEKGMPEKGLPAASAPAMPPMGQLVKAVVGMSRQEVDAVLAIVKELNRARALHSTPMRSAHEGFGVIYEEVHELLDEVRSNDRIKQLKEATQIGAMAARFLIDLGGRS